ncbi:Ldh family oxidoreductase [Pseudochrobactrum sp. MP213Fo]|uniref:Ldh family oxidoreductase n=1 Tax=Pseudochrobactrum sp. MP213Fo TaxID=3022250 RepID=UPI003B9E5329
MTVIVEQEQIALSDKDVFNLAYSFLTKHGLSDAQSNALATVLYKAQRDECRSHGLQRLAGTLETMAHPAFNREADPQPVEITPAVIQVDANYGFSILAVERALPQLISNAKRIGIAVLAINNGFHSTALWPVVEELAENGLAALSMNPTHDWVVPAGGISGALGTNPIAFAWPRTKHAPYVFDFATSAAARADIALYRQEGRAIPADWGVDADGQPTTDPAAVLAGAMLPFGGHKGSALATMIELLAGPFIGDRTSRQSAAFDQGARAAPCHGELIIAFNPDLMSAVAGKPIADDGAEDLFARITAQGARLPGERRYQARKRSAENGIKVPKALYNKIKAMI